MTALVFIFIGGWIINQHCLPELLNPISLLVNIGILIFTVFLAWCLLKPKKAGTLIVGTFIFISVVFFVTSFTAGDLKHTASSSINTLKSLPYLKWVPVEETVEKSGVTRYNPKLACDGINIFCLEALSTIYLMDMAGNILHTWSTTITKKPIFWQYAKLCKNGDLLCGAYWNMLAKFDWYSNIIWIKKMCFHHDISLDENEDIYVLDSRFEMAFFNALPLPIINDYFLILSQDGETKRNISSFKILKNQINLNKVIKLYCQRISLKNLKKAFVSWMEGNLDTMVDTSFDIFHNNTITIIDRDIKGLCKKGNLLISVRQLDLIGILDIDKEQLIWTWGPGNLDRQHQPTLLENGNILIYDNGTIRGYSRVIELEPIKKEIVWEYKANPPEQFYSDIRGGCQRLPNGNTLITEDSKGRAFEVTKDGQIVWEFFTPIETKKNSAFRASIYRMTRITDLENYPRLKELTF